MSGDEILSDFCETMETRALFVEWVANKQMNIWDSGWLILSFSPTMIGSMNIVADWSIDWLIWFLDNLSYVTGGAVLEDGDGIDLV